jgi:hypothetical protein
MKRANTIFMRERFLGYVMSEVGSSGGKIRPPKAVPPPIDLQKMPQI